MQYQDLYLIQKGHMWFAAVQVPTALRPVIGKKRLTRTLNTRDIVEARKRKGPVVDAIKAQIEEARVRRETAKRSSLELAVQEAISWKREQDDPSNRMHLDIKVDEIERKHGEDVTRTFVQIATGSATPLDAHMESWLAGSSYTERTKADCRTAVSRLSEHLGTNSTVEAVTGREAVRFRDECLVKKGVNFKTGNKHMSCLRRYWKWMGDSEHLGGDWRNPWAGKSLPKPKARSIDDKERPFHDEELKALLAGDERVAKSDLDVIRIAALSGARLEEIFQLRVKHTRHGIFTVGHKTDAAIRQVPVHSGLKELVARLVEDKKDDDFIIADAEATGWDGMRSMAFSKRFATYRRRLGIDDMAGQGGKRRRSRTNFHSVRRWFITTCERAGVPETMTMRVVGHRISGQSYGTYSGGATIEQLRAVVEAVKLPV